MDLHGMVLLAGGASAAPLEALLIAFVFLYIGPELILPLASFVASIIGLLLMFWRYIVRSVRKMIRWIFRRKAAPVAAGDDETGPTAPVTTEPVSQQMASQQIDIDM